jgi:hypothetical protein
LLGDTAIVQLITIDQEGFDFFNTLNATLDNNSGSPFSGTPQNPLTNITNEGLGFFGAFNIVSDTIIIQ